MPLRRLALVTLGFSLIAGACFAEPPRPAASDRLIERTAQPQPKLWPGVYRATVVSYTPDPEGRQRIQVNIPAAGLTNIWALPCRPYGANGPLPPYASTVWVAFENGDEHFPVWLGSLPPPPGQSR